MLPLKKSMYAINYRHFNRTLSKNTFDNIWINSPNCKSSRSIVNNWSRGTIFSPFKTSRYVPLLILPNLINLELLIKETLVQKESLKSDKKGFIIILKRKYQLLNHYTPSQSIIYLKTLKICRKFNKVKSFPILSVPTEAEQIQIDNEGMSSITQNNHREHQILA